MIGVIKLLQSMANKERRWTMLSALSNEERMNDAECPNCGATGKFASRGIPVRPAALCMNCGSLERHRLFYLAHAAGKFSFAGKDVLHFAPERINRVLIEREGASRYRSADIEPGKAELTLDIETIDLPDASVDIIVANHVLEHVDERATLASMFRVLRPGGQALLMVPMIEGWEETYENPAVTSDADRWRHFGLESHVRYFGRDFRSRITDAGFELDEYTALGADSVRYGLIRGEKVFIAKKPAS